MAQSAAAHKKHGSHIRLSVGDRLFVILNYTLLALVMLIVLYPLIYIVSCSFSSPAAVTGGAVWLFPVDFSLVGYETVFKNSEIIPSFWNAVLITVVGTIINVTCTIMAAYPLARKGLFGRGVITGLFAFTMLFNGGLVPTYLVYTKYLHLGNTIWALIIPSLLMNAFHVMLVRNYFSTSIPESLIESAKLDGASEMMIFRAIVLPLSKPIMATIGLMLALSYWNNWTNGLYYLDDTSLYSIQNVLNAINNNIIAINSVSNMGLAINKSEVPALTARMAIAVIGIVPMLCIYPFFQKYFVKGITIGAVKG